MAAVTKRAYDATGRQAAAQERRARVAVTAARLFAERGWAGTTVAAVAEDAGVSPELVTKAFGGKPGLFMAAFRTASFGSLDDLPAAVAALGLETEPDLEVRLDLMVEFACQSLVPMAPLVSVMEAGAEQDPELRELLTRAQEGHARAAAEVARLLSPGEPGPDAADEVYVLTRAEAYLALVHQRGWALPRYAAWLRRSLRRAVAPEPY